VVDSLAGPHDARKGRKVVGVALAAIEFLQALVVGIEATRDSDVFAELNREKIIGPCDVDELVPREGAPIQVAYFVDYLRVRRRFAARFLPWLKGELAGRPELYLRRAHGDTPFKEI
jgi:hypothetical protein